MLHQLELNHPEIKAVLMGTRHTDPYAGKNLYSTYRTRTCVHFHAFCK